MEFIKEGNDSIVISCKGCSKQHEIKKLYYFKTSNDYRLVKAIVCDCGNTTDKIEGGTVSGLTPPSDQWTISLAVKAILIISIPIIIIVFLVKGCIASYIEYDKNDYKDFNDLTRQEYNDYMKLERKQQEKKWNNEKMFGN
ncbi:hypothetical protein [Paenibacillus paridis]|uniref:hypothetical protein n=1 Tax=Paenibacillus paridis TaxID=2583376 RepID=UPI00111F5BB6|nr:hypothetical protein [Paenibacillus paridis]